MALDDLHVRMNFMPPHYTRQNGQEIDVAEINAKVQRAINKTIEAAILAQRENAVNILKREAKTMGKYIVISKDGEELGANGEPFFVLRAKDIISVETLRSYLWTWTYKNRNHIQQEGDDVFMGQIHNIIADFENWQKDNPSLVRMPRPATNEKYSPSKLSVCEGSEVSENREPMAQSVSVGGNPDDYLSARKMLEKLYATIDDQIALAEKKYNELAHLLLEDTRKQYDKGFDREGFESHVKEYWGMGYRMTALRELKCFDIQGILDHARQEGFREGALKSHDATVEQIVEAIKKM